MKLRLALLALAVSAIFSLQAVIVKNETQKNVAIKSVRPTLCYNKNGDLVPMPDDIESIPFVKEVLPSDIYNFAGSFHNICLVVKGKTYQIKKLPEASVITVYMNEDGNTKIRVDRPE